MFTIPNEAECAYTVTVGGETFAPQATPDRVDIDILVAAAGGTGVVSGCAVSAQATPDGTVAVAAGIVAVTRVPQTVSGGTVNVLSGAGGTAAHATLPRFSLVVADSAGAVSSVAGNAAAAPAFPSLPAAAVALAAVYVPPADTTVGADQLVDKRAPWLPGAGIRDRAWLGPAPAVGDDEFNDEAVGPEWVQVVPSGTLTVVEAGDVLSVKAKGQTAEHAACLLRPLPAGFGFGNYIETAVRMFTMQNYVMAGLVLADGDAASASVVWQVPYLYTSGVPYAVLSLRRGPMNAAKTILVDQSTNHVARGWLYQRLTWVAASTWRAEWSIDGVSWSEFGQGDKTFAMTPTHMGLGFSSWGGVQDSLVAAEYFRVG